jgi:hypothetical protein
MPPQGYERDQQWVNALDILNAELDKPDEPVEIRFRTHYPHGPADGTRRIGGWKHIDYCSREYAKPQLEGADQVEMLYTRPQSCEGCKTATKTEPKPEPVGHLDGLDANADFMSMEIRKAHEARNSSTPRTYTIPVYTRPQSCECCKPVDLAPNPRGINPQSKWPFAPIKESEYDRGFKMGFATAIRDMESTFHESLSAPVPPAELMPFSNKGMP